MLRSKTLKGLTPLIKKDNAQEIIINTAKQIPNIIPPIKYRYNANYYDKYQPVYYQHTI